MNSAGSFQYRGLAHHHPHHRDKSLLVKLPGNNVVRKLSEAEVAEWKARIQGIIDQTSALGRKCGV